MPKFHIAFLCFLVLYSAKKSAQVRVATTSHSTPSVNQVRECVRQWSKQLGKELYELSSTMTRKAKLQKSFNKLKDKIHYEVERTLLRTITQKLKNTIKKKVDAVANIAEYAEFLAFHRKTNYSVVNGVNGSDYLDPNAFFFYNADNITNTTCDCDKEKDLEDEIREMKCIWFCEQKDLPDLNPLPHNSFTKKKIEDMFGPVCDCSQHISKRPSENYNLLPLKPHPNFDTPVNFNLSVVRIVANVFAKEQEVMQGAKWTAPLDMVFKENLAKDPTLKYQYFASPLGYMRHFPAVKWSDERYAQTYDPRTRSWYTEAMTSPKDIIILLDSSGSVLQLKRKVAAHIVNNILDTLNDNDFVNIYLFANSTRPLVPCFKDTLVQANEENLRLLRETLDNYKPTFQAEIETGLAKAFSLLKEMRQKKVGSECNQAIMLITEEAFFRKDQKEFFMKYNWNDSTPVRVFTYLLEKNEGDAHLLEWVACSNKGYFVNISLSQEAREKVLPYLNVMSRPLNKAHKDNPKREEFIWSYLYIDLADRRYTNWLWRKVEGNRQRSVFLDHAKREFHRLKKVLANYSHFLLQENHPMGGSFLSALTEEGGPNPSRAEFVGRLKLQRNLHLDYEKYGNEMNYDYMTTVSLPVFSRKPEDVDIIGVAGVDIPLKLLMSLIPHHTIGVNGYAFIVTNNGYILMHPGHRREFNNIPKPTFNRVDLLEVEILDDTSKPREFGERIVEMRKNIVLQKLNSLADDVLNVKQALDDHKRIILTRRRYVYMKLVPAFTVGIALPDKYGNMVVDIKNVTGFEKSLLNTKNWTVHPDWVYCPDDSGAEPEEIVKRCLRQNQKNNTKEPLLKALLFDAEETKWFEEDIPNEDFFVRKFLVDNVFMATHSGLVRWKTCHPEKYEDVVDDDEGKGKKEYFRGNRSIDEDWYQRVVEENIDRNDDVFIYSVPFEISGYEYNTMITSTNAIFVTAEGKKSPVAAVGVQFNHRKMSVLYDEITKKCKGPNGQRMCACNANFVLCFILDNNAYIILGSQIEYTGRFIGDVSPIITHQLIRNGVYKRIEMYDYQAICQKPPEAKKKNAGTRVVTFVRTLLENLLRITDWAFATILLLLSSVTAGPEYQSAKNETVLYEKLEINKTVPTPCDKAMWLFTLAEDFKPFAYANTSSKEGCNWYYVVERIPHSNLLFMATNYNCEGDNLSKLQSHNETPTPVEIDYPDDLPCHIATHNNYTRRFYGDSCYNNTSDEDNLNLNRYYCGHTWEP